MTRISLFILALAATACGAKQTVDAPVEAPQPLRLTSDGLVPEPQSPVTAASLDATFDGYSVAGSEGSDRFAIRENGATLVVVDLLDDGGYRAKVVDERVEGPGGISVGAGWRTLEAMAEIQCRRGSSQWAEQVYCTTSDVPNIAFVFEVPVAATPACPADCVLESNAVLAAHQVDSIEWQP